LQKGIRGKNRDRNLNGRKRQSGASARSDRTKKRAIKAAAGADALANVDSVKELTVDGAANAAHGMMASTRIVTPVKEYKQGGFLVVLPKDILANNGIGTVTYDEPVPQGKYTDQAKVKATKEAAV